jgi:hypothetical protein
MMWLPPLSAVLQNVRETFRVSGCRQCAAAVRVHSYGAPMKSRLHTGARKGAHGAGDTEDLPMKCSVPSTLQQRQLIRRALAVGLTEDMHAAGVS